MQVSSQHAACFEPAWPAPANVKIAFTTRISGYSEAPYDGFNMGSHVGDVESCVANNRRSLFSFEGLDDIQWLNQTHGIDVCNADIDGRVITADACYTNKHHLACAVLTADCLPVLFCDDEGKEVAAAHAGWRGLAAGVLVNTVAKFQASPSAIHACFGPCIAQCHFEVGEEVRDTFLSSGSFDSCQLDIEKAFIANNGKYHADLKLLAEIQLKSLGLKSITSNNYCTYCDSDKFYSYRRASVTGRMASFIYLS